MREFGHHTMKPRMHNPKIIEHRWALINQTQHLYTKLDGDPDCIGLVYARRGNIVRAQRGDFVHFNLLCPLERGGYDGGAFNFDLDDGTQIENSGAWSSRPGVVNKFFPELDECVDVGCDGIARYMTAKSLIEYLDRVSDPMQMFRTINSYGEVVYYFGYVPYGIENEQRIR